MNNEQVKNNIKIKIYKIRCVSRSLNDFESKYFALFKKNTFTELTNEEQEMYNAVERKILNYKKTINGYMIDILSYIDQISVI